MEIKFDEKNKKAKLIVNADSGSNRKRHTRTISYIKKKDAEKAWVAFEAEIAGGLETKMTVSELLEWYIDAAEISGVKATTIKAYRSAEKPIVDFFKGERSSLVSTYRVERFIASERKKRSPKTIKTRCPCSPLHISAL